jgi:hypothetical protein
VVGALKLPLPGADRSLPFRDHARYWLSPWKHDEDSAGRFARAAIDQLEAASPRAILFADTTSYWPLRWVAEVERGGAGVRLVGGSELGLLKEFERDPEAFWQKARREKLAVFVVSRQRRYCPKAIEPFVAPAPSGVLYRVSPPAR